MKTIIDLTGGSFDCVDAEWASLRMVSPIESVDAFLIDVWGILFRTRESGNIHVPDLSFTSSEHSVFVNGWTQLSFEKPQFIDMVVALYDDNSDDFRRDEQGEVIQIRSCSGHQGLGTGASYPVGGRMLQPHGDCQLAIGTDGKVCAEFNSEDCITAERASQLRLMGQRLCPPPSPPPVRDGG